MSDISVSVIVPTYNRVNDLGETLDSILIQTVLPAEVLVVDNGDDVRTTELIEERATIFAAKNMRLLYIKSPENSLTVAKNLGIVRSTGDIIFFLDDDVVLYARYIEEILRVYADHPDALGVQGIGMPKTRNRNGILSGLQSLLHKLFYFDYVEKDTCRLLPSTSGTYPPYLDKGNIINCEWLAGASSYKRILFQEFSFDENLKKYSHKEDQDFSYRVFKKYPRSLFMTADATFTHKVSQTARLPDKTLIYMRRIYALYFFYKNIDQTMKNKLILLWSWTGFLIMETGILFGSYLVKGSKTKPLKIKFIFGAYFTCLKHLKEIKKGDLSFFNTELMSE